MNSNPGFFLIGGDNAPPDVIESFIRDWKRRHPDDELNDITERVTDGSWVVEVTSSVNVHQARQVAGEIWQGIFGAPECIIRSSRQVSMGIRPRQTLSIPEGTVLPQFHFGPA